MKKYWLGPELIWLMAFAVIKIMAQLNHPPDFILDWFLESLWFIIPAFAFCTFLLGFSAKFRHSVFALRLWITGILGSHFTMEAGLSAFSEQGPGIGTAYIIGMILLFPFLLAGNLIWLFRKKYSKNQIIKSST